MALAIPDEVLRQAGLSEHEMAIEIACRLFAAQVLSKPQASRLCALNRVQFEEELCKRDCRWSFTRQTCWRRISSR